MITILHGDDIALSRKTFQEYKDEVKNSVTFDGEKVTVAEVIQNQEGTGLFEEKISLFFENFFTKRKPGKEFDKIIFLVKEYEHNVYFWETKELTKKFLNLFQKCTVKNFKIPQTLFIFLENIKPNNGKKLIELFHHTLQTNEPEMIFFMITRQFRLLLAVSDHDSKERIDEVEFLAPWQSSRLQSQARLFKEEGLRNIYRRLFEIDLAQKTGQSPFTLIQDIDFLLLDI